MRRRVLFILPEGVWSPYSGGGQRTTLIYRALVEAYDVDVIVAGGKKSAGFEEYFPDAKRISHLPLSTPGERGIWKALRPLNPKLVETFATAFASREELYQPAKEALIDIAAYDAVIIRYFKTAARLGLLRKSGNVLIDIDDRDDKVSATRIKLTHNKLLRALKEKRREKVVEIFHRLTSRAAHLWFVSEEDFTPKPATNISLLPNIPFSAPKTPPPPAPPGANFLFIGAAWHGPNVDGLIRFVKGSWPRILKVSRSSQLRIVGAGRWDTHAGELLAPNVSIIGQVDDLAAEYEKANVVVSPVFEGGGSKIKVLEALSFNRPVVASTHSARGFDDDLVSNALVTAEDDSGLAQGCLDLISNHDRAAGLAAKGREIVMQRYSWDAFRQLVLDPCETVIAEGKSAVTESV